MSQPHFPVDVKSVFVSMTLNYISILCYVCAHIIKLVGNSHNLQSPFKGVHITCCFVHLTNEGCYSVIGFPLVKLFSNFAPRVLSIMFLENWTNGIFHLFHI